MSKDLFKKQFVDTYVDLYLAVLDRIKFANNFAAHQRFLEQQRFEAERQFQTDDGFGARFEAGKSYDSDG